MLKFISLSLLIAVALTFVYLLNTSNALSYLSSDPKACINCHVMNTQYATWQHSSHANAASCVQCHLPEKGVEKYLAKIRDGWHHSLAFTLNSYKPSITISEDGASRVQKNCISCHKKITSVIVENSSKYHNYGDDSLKTSRKCWNCHKGVPHGAVRSLTATPYNLGVKQIN